MDEEYDFDALIAREHTDCVKWDGRKGYFGAEDLLPMWVADMDFAAPPALTRALLERAGHPVYGYTLYPDSLHDALIGWMRRRHGWDIRKEWIVYTPGVVTALHAAVMALTAPGQTVAVQPPVYFPFFTAVTQTGRRLAFNPLRLENGRYVMDFEGLERCAADGARLLLLCSPHNPVGRVWREEELRQVLAIARRYEMTILSDEIHHDLIFSGVRHTPTAVLAQARDSVIAAVAPSKTFNIPGLGLSALIIPDAGQRASVRKTLELLHVGASNPFSIVAFEAAYRFGDPWLNALLAYLEANRDHVCARLPESIRALPAEGTYLLWLDCRRLGLDDEGLKKFFAERAKVGMNPGIVFGEGGSGFMRMNIGTRRAALDEALSRIRQAMESVGFS